MLTGQKYVSPRALKAELVQHSVQTEHQSKQVAVHQKMLLRAQVMVREEKYAVVAVTEEDRQELHRLGNESECKVARQLEMAEVNKIGLSILREDNERMLPTIFDLARCLSAAESEAAREFATERKKRRLLRNISVWATVWLISGRVISCVSARGGGRAGGV